MATRKQFVELETMDTVIARGSNTVGGTVIGDYIKDGGRVVVVKMPKVEKKPKKVKKGPVTGQVVDAVKRQTQAQRIQEEIDRETPVAASAVHNG